MARDLAAQYERLYPGTGIPEAHKQERMERELFKRERLTLHRTGRNRGLVVPDLPVDNEGRLRP